MNKGTLSRLCTNCGKQFSAERKQGRPPSFCSEKCKLEARGSNQRLCVTCGNKFERNSSPWPNHCSDKCHTAQTNRCRNPVCERTQKARSLFCSAECMVATQGRPDCQVCNRPVPVPRRPPFTRMPNYCSPQHRAIGAARAGHHLKDTALFRTQVEQLKMVDTLPMFANGHPFTMVDPDEIVPVTAANGFGPRSVRSVKWWNHILSTLNTNEAPHSPLLDNPEVRDIYVAYTGLRGWGGGDAARHGCLRLARCWLWLTPEAMLPFNSYAVLEYWKSYAKVWPHTEESLDFRRDRLLARLTNEAFRTKCRNDLNTRHRTVQAINKINQDAMPVPLDAWIPRRHATLVDQLDDLLFTHNQLYVNKYKKEIATVTRGQRPSAWTSITEEFIRQS